MTSQVKWKLSAVRWRQRLLSGLHGATWGLLCGGAATTVFGITRWLQSLPNSPWWGAVGILGGVLCGLLIGLMRRADWHEAAKSIDNFYQLKDRTATALAFLGKSDDSAMRQLQIDDALQHLETVNATEVVPFRTHKSLPYAVAVSVLAVGTLLFSVWQQPVVAGPTAPLGVVVAQADRMAEELRKLEEFAKEEKQTDPQIEKLIDELKEKIDELKQPDVDQREALAKLSEMQAKLQAQQQQYDVAAVDAQMQAIAEALALAVSLSAVSKPLKEGKYDQVAEELDKLEMPQLDRQTEKTVKEKLAKLAEAMRDAGQAQLGQCTGDISEGLGEQGDKFKEGSKKLAGECRKQGRRKKLHDLLQSQCQCLGECKSECEGGNKSKGQSNKKGGKDWGLGASGNEPGELTPNLGGKQKEQLTGKLSEEGESEVESTQSPDGKQDAQRQYRQNYDKYRQISESVLDSEPIPLGHRQVIRRYFESIRPQGETTTESVPTETPKQ